LRTKPQTTTVRVLCANPQRRAVYPISGDSSRPEAPAAHLWAAILGQFRRVLDDQIRVLGRDHHDTLTTRSYMAIWLGQSGRAEATGGSEDPPSEVPLRYLGGGAEEDAMSDDCGDANHAAQVAVYTEIGNNYRAMDDLRLRLLALLPLATGAGILVLLGGHGVSAAIDVPVGLFGMVATISLYFYELHGIEKCAHYIDAGAKLEEDFKVRGSFTNRPHRIFGVVSELLPAALIYPASFTGWLFLALYHVGNITRGRVTGAVFIVSVAASAVAIFVVQKRRPKRRCSAWCKRDTHDTLGQGYRAH
jgi:hypothetical protein